MKNILIILSLMFLLVSCFWWTKPPPSDERSFFFIEVTGTKGSTVNITYLGYVDDGNPHNEVRKKTVSLPYIEDVGIHFDGIPWVSVTNTCTDTITVYCETNSTGFAVEDNCRYFYLLSYNQYPNPELYKATPCVYKISLDSAHVLLKKSDYPYFKLVVPNETVKFTVKE